MSLHFEKIIFDKTKDFISRFTRVVMMDTVFTVNIYGILHSVIWWWWIFQNFRQNGTHLFDNVTFGCWSWMPCQPCHVPGIFLRRGHCPCCRWIHTEYWIHSNKTRKKQRGLFLHSWTWSCFNIKEDLTHFPDAPLQMSLELGLVKNLLVKKIWNFCGFTSKIVTRKNGKNGKEI